MCGEHGIVWIDDCAGHLRRGVHPESDLRLLAVIDGETLEEQGDEAGTCIPPPTVFEMSLVCKIRGVCEGIQQNHLHVAHENTPS